MSEVQAAGGAHALRGKAARLFAIAAVALALDQLTKALAVAHLHEGRSVHAIDGIMYFTLQRNPGAAFSLFTRFPVVFTVLATAISVAIVVGARRVRDMFTAVALGLVLGGALGNLVDRIARPPGAFRGHVIDFIDFRVWPVFNIADACIVVGALLLLLASFRRERSS